MLIKILTCYFTGVSPRGFKRHICTSGDLSEQDLLHHNLLQFPGNDLHIWDAVRPHFPGYPESPVHEGEMSLAQSRLQRPVSRSFWSTVEGKLSAKRNDNVNTFNNCDIYIFMDISKDLMIFVNIHSIFVNWFWVL